MEIAALLPIFLNSRRVVMSVIEDNEDINFFPILERIAILMCNEDIPKIQNFYEETVPQYSFSTFKGHFRVTTGTFEFILNQIENCPLLRKRNRLLFGGRDQVTAEKGLLITLWALGTPESYRSIGDRFNVAKSTVFHCLHTMVNIIVHHLGHKFIKWPHLEERPMIAHGFSSYGLEHVVGIIDGCHIPIKKPQNSEMDYFNRKKFYSVVLQGICNNNLLFTDVDVRWPGGVHDARVLRTSDFYQVAEEACAPHYYIIGDSAYPCKQWLITPYRNNGNLTEDELYFNTQLARTRGKIELCFALLEGRFRRLKEQLDMDRIENINKTIVACCILHNICILQGESNLQEYINEAMPRGEQVSTVGVQNP